MTRFVREGDLVVGTGLDAGALDAWWPELAACLAQGGRLVCLELDAAPGWTRRVLLPRLATGTALAIWTATDGTAHVGAEPAAAAARAVTVVQERLGLEARDAGSLEAAELAPLLALAAPPAPAGVPIARPLLDGREAVAAAAVIQGGWVMQGPQVAALEAEFAAFTGSPYACAVSSGTAALHLALRAVGVSAGDEVVTVSHSFVATANAVRLCGAAPVFVDVDEHFNIDPAQAAAALGPRTRALLVVHQMGMPCDLARLAPIAAGAGIPLVEDAACAAGSALAWQGRWERIGKPHGAVACFSFHPRKLLTTGEGGMITTADPAIDRAVRRLRQHGLEASDGEALEPGLNYRLTDVQAAIGRVQLRRLPALVEERRAQAARYAALLAALPRVTAPPEPAWARSNWQSYCVRLPEDADGAAVRRQLADAGIATRPGVHNAHEMRAHADVPRRFPLPRSEAAHRRGLMLPLYPGLDAETQAQIVGALGRALDP